MWRWKQILELGRHLGIIALLKASGFQKCRSLTLSKHLFVLKLKKTILHGLSMPKPNFSEFAFFGKQICRLGIMDFNLPSNWWVSQLKNPNLLFFFIIFLLYYIFILYFMLYFYYIILFFIIFWVFVLGFEKLGLEVDNCGWTTKKRLLFHL